MHEVSTKIGGHLVMEEDEQKLRVRLVGPDGRRQSAVRPRTAGASGIEAHFAAVITFQAGFQRGKATLESRVFIYLSSWAINFPKASSL